MLPDIIKHFFPNDNVVDVKPFGHGHINTTYKLELESTGDCYILQKINTDVFKDPHGIAATHERLQNQIAWDQHFIEIAKLIYTCDGKPLFVDADGGVWRMTSFVDDSYTIDVVEETWQATEAGRAFGCFAFVCNALKVHEFKESITDFHRLPFRIKQLDDAIAANAAGRYDKVKHIVDFFKDREKQMSYIEQLVDSGEIPLRVVHNDTKINNLLFRGSKAVAVIDLDTVGPGILYYDYGDALRTSANTAEEDEKDLSKVSFNMDAFAAFTKGYMEQVSPILSAHEEKYFYMAPFLMTYIMGIRFLADYLNGDVYYKIVHADHNIDRCMVQKKLIESMEQNEAKMKETINIKILAS
jgi:hypothetical protein